MDAAQVSVRNPFAFRECLEVALEVTWPDVAQEQADALRTLLRAIPCKVAAAQLPMGPCERQALLACGAHFRRSRTWYWLRSDLSEAWTDMEHQLQRNL
ncbi:MAG: hypothetical protein K0R39_3067 [Symbiobacteriaceae bacterium]|nr:hypothetical protein [Symbiobacteriaceae bacterium]